MGLLTALKIVKEKPNDLVETDRKRVKEINANIDILRNEIANLVSTLQNKTPEEIDIALQEIVRKDRNILVLLRESGDDQAFSEVREIIELVRSELIQQKIGGNEEHTRKLLENIKSILSDLKESELRDLKVENNCLKDYLGLYNANRLMEEDIRDFFNSHKSFFKVKTRKRLAKRMKQELKERTIKEEVNYVTKLDRIAHELIKIESRKSSKEENRELMRHARELKILFPDLNKDVKTIYRELSKLMHALKKSEGRKGL